MKVTICPDQPAAAALAAERMAAAIAAAREARGVAHISLAGSNTPRPAYEALAGLVEDWAGVHVWFGDERCVGPEDPESNYRMARETLLARGEIPEAQVHRIAGELGALVAAERYEAEVRATIAEPKPGRTPALDLALLGLGGDGHTASLFPGAGTLHDGGILCLPVHDAPKPPPDRVTMTLELLGAARAVLVLAPGASKADAVRRVQAGPDDAVPASLLPEHTELVLDPAAAGESLTP